MCLVKPLIQECHCHVVTILISKGSAIAVWCHYSIFALNDFLLNRQKKLALILCELKVLFAEGAAAVVLTIKPVLFAELYAFVVAVALFEVGRQPQRVARGKFFADGVK